MQIGTHLVWAQNSHCPSLETTIENIPPCLLSLSGHDRARENQRDFNTAQYMVTFLTQKEINNIKDPSPPWKETHLSLSNVNQ